MRAVCVFELPRTFIFCIKYHHTSACAIFLSCSVLSKKVHLLCSVFCFHFVLFLPAACKIPEYRQREPKPKKEVASCQDMKRAHGNLSHSCDKCTELYSLRGFLLFVHFTLYCIFSTRFGPLILLSILCVFAHDSMCMMFYISGKYLLLARCRALSRQGKSIHDCRRPRGPHQTSVESAGHLCTVYRSWRSE